MHEQDYLTLAKIRLERAEELYEEACSLLKDDHYKSANNRSFYAIEKCIKALLATEGIEVNTHNGSLKQFNYVFIHNGDGTFTSDDYRIIAGAEQIRNFSDYDDFYIASKEETRSLVQNTRTLLDKVEFYLKGRIIISNT